MTSEPLYYLRGRTIYKRPTEVTGQDGSKITASGFAVCEVTRWANPAALLNMLNNSNADRKI